GAEEAQPLPTQTIETPREELTTGSTFAGRYQIIEELGKGGMGKVYKVLDKETNEKIALKLIKPEIASDKKTVERFRNELTTARQIVQKNVCRMYDLNKEEGNYYITMEYISGQDLKGLIRQTGQLTVGKSISIAKQICDGLSEAHSLGVVHRDLKPNNIMIDRGGNAKIMDFGIARAVKGKSITGPGVMIGTPQYMSPEQVEGKDVDQRSDIYSLGIILYEMLTDRVPFEGDTPLTVGVKQKTETPEDPKSFNERIHDDLNQLVLKCLKKERASRYQNAEEMRCELERLEQGLPPTDRVTAKKKPLTSREITVQFNLKRLLIPALAIIAVAVVGLIIWSPWTQNNSTTILSEKPSIAVLPFDDESPQKDQGALCNGIPEQIILALSRVENLSVPAPTSSFSLRGKDIKEIGEKLKVKTVLKGSLRKAGNRVRITPRLVNIDDGTLIWGETYDSEQDDIFVIQDEITLKIIEMLKVKLLGEERENVVKRYTNNSEAYDLYLKGRHFWNERTEEGFEQTIRYLREAIEKDPSYALAYAGIADTYNILGWYSHLSPFDAFPKAKAAALRALEIDDDLAEAHASLAAYFLWHEWDWISAEREFKRSIDLNPGYATAHHWYADCLTIMRRADEAIAEMKRAQELDPLSLIINTDLAKEYLYARNYDQALKQCEKTLELNPNFYRVYKYLGQIYVQNSQLEEAISVFQDAKDLSRGHPAVLAWLGYVYGLSGRVIEAHRLIEELENTSTQQYVSPIYYSFVHIGLGDIDRAFIWLEKAYDERSSWLIYIHRSPIYENLRTDNRYDALLRKMNLE
ncbi:protein kinase, partial [Acidobacteriota bacterium]